MKIARRKMAAEVPSMAMGDIAFNLLIFFVILARATDDSHLKWEPAAVQKVESAGEASVRVVIDSDFKVYINGQETHEEGLAGAIQEQLGDAPQGKRTVLLKADRSATAQTFEPVIEAISQAGGDLVHVVDELPKQ